jgi:hypothetical protein
MSLGERFHTLFMGLEKSHGTYKVDDSKKPAGDKVKGKALTVHASVTNALWDRHLAGEIGIGIIPIREDGTCLWGAIDVDDYTTDHIELGQRIKNIGAPLLVCRTKSGGAHMYMFFSEPIPGTLLRDKLRECSVALGVWKKELEIFPKQKALETDATGNWINMPYQHADFTTRYCIHNEKPLAAEEFLTLAESYKVNLQFIQSFIPKLAKNDDNLDDEWSEAPPCLEYLVKNGFPEGSKNNALLSLAVYARKRYEDWKTKVSEYNTAWMRGSFEEVAGIIKSIGKKEYRYKCGDVPLWEHCNKEQCKRRRFGIGETRGVGRPSASAADKDAILCVLEEVDRPIRVYRPPDGSSDEPQWIFPMSNGHQLDVTLDMILDQGRFLREYTKRFERVRLPVPAPKWQILANELMAEAEVMELPADAGPEGQLMLHLEAFCLGKVTGLDKDEITLGHPWTDPDGITWFRSKDFLKYLNQERFKAFKLNELYAIFRKHGGKNDKFMIKKKCWGVWGFPEFQHQTEDFASIVIPLKDEEERF